MQLLKNRALAVAIGAGVLVAGANLTAYAAGGHAFFGAHHTTSPARSGHHSSGAHVYEYVVPAKTPLPYDFKTKGLPKGRYTVSLSIATKTPQPDPTVPLPAPFCSVSGGGKRYPLFSYGIYSGQPSDSSDVAINTGSGLITITKTGATFGCEGGGHSYNTGGSHNIVVFTPVSKVTIGKVKNVVVARTGAKVSPFAH